ncbi:uncharacterized protein LOC6532839 [Drosophila yakuba]|uniref:Uncharacterized protein n=1 Tax=Drosophila yakuba TaxID=7245 RepID=B4PH51_DROYA|nr:uncharacterized protein LOC6532839 [Drosophila yakuba]EDW93288.1 uncharacterized protein Dyak_GE21374 [Drosophila yakuba]
MGSINRRNEPISRDEVQRLLRNPSNNPDRMLLFLDTRFASEDVRNSNRVMPDIHIFSGPVVQNLRPFVPVNLSNENSWVYSVLLQEPIVRPAPPGRIRYTAVSRWSPPTRMGRNVIFPEDIRGLILMAMIVNPEIDTLMNIDPIKAMSLMLNIALYFLT